MIIEIMSQKYIDYIASAYGITFFVLIGLVVWSVVQFKTYKAQLAKLEAQGIRRRSSKKMKKDAVNE